MTRGIFPGKLKHAPPRAASGLVGHALACPSAFPTSNAGHSRSARVPALAKINLDLRVLARRPDGFHELRTVFQTISLADSIEIEFTPGARTGIDLDDGLNIPGNLVLRAAECVMEAARARGTVRMRLSKKIPMGAGLGGGSSDAAAILLALPALIGRRLPMEALCRMGASLGSDVPFFLLGGAAAGFGRGTELVPLPDPPVRYAILIAPGIHSDTRAAYAALSPGLTTESQQNKIVSFQSLTWELRASGVGSNDFEPVVFRQHRRLAALKKALAVAGASSAMMTGSGSALFGLFPTRREADEGLGRLDEANALREGDKVFRVSLVSRARYRALWSSALAGHVVPQSWPPGSRYI
jgi:4-diphosphocytidyl-2-C-methyl-D-erythritol kinase